MSIRNKGRPQRGLYRRGDIWWIDYTDQTGRRVRESTGTPNKSEATKFLHVRKAEVAQGKFSIEKTRSAPRFVRFAKTYLDEYAKVNKRSWKCDEIALRKHLTPFFGNKPLDRIAEIDVQRYKRKREKEISTFPKNLGKPKREITFVAINRELALLRKMFNQAISWGRVRENPVNKNVRFYEEHERVRYLSDEEETLLISFCPAPLTDVVVFAINTGLRRSEISSLNWGDVDISRGSITIRAGYSKNGETRRIPINDSVKRLLKQLKGATDIQGAVFRNNLGRSFQSSGIATAFKRVVKKAGIKDLTFHDLRHTFASRLAMSGVDLYTIQKLLGHRNQKMTLRYSHLSDVHLQNAVCKLDPVIEISTVRHNHGTIQKERGHAVNVTP